MNIYDTLASLNITLPPVATPAAAYVPFVQTGKLVFISGHIAKKDGKPWVGQLGKNMQTEEGAAAARAMLRHTTLPAERIVREALAISGEMCIYSNTHITVETL